MSAPSWAAVTTTTSSSATTASSTTRPLIPPRAYVPRPSLAGAQWGDDQDASDIDRISTTDPNDGGNDVITSGAGYDFIFGGTGDDRITAGAGNDLVFGDHGKVEAVNPALVGGGYGNGGVIARALPMSGTSDYAAIPQLASLNGYQDPFVFTAINTRNVDVNAAYTALLYETGSDVIFGEDGEDIILGQQGDDRIYGGNDDDDIIGGHNVALGEDGNDRIDGGSESRGREHDCRRDRQRRHRRRQRQHPAPGRPPKPTLPGADGHA